MLAHEPIPRKLCMLDARLVGRCQQFRHAGAGADGWFLGIGHHTPRREAF